MKRCSISDWALAALLLVTIVPVLGYVWILFIGELKSRFGK
jgi:hypothetical protein